MAHLGHVLSLVRHGESEGNAAHERAHAQGAETIDVTPEDRNVALTPRGIDQAKALGLWFAADSPTLVLSSPYRRTLETARVAAAQWGSAVPIVEDERLRERSLGIVNRLTGAGIRARFPREAQERRRLGKFYYRPPGGENWEDVALRLRPLVDALHMTEEPHILMVTHQVVILCMRYLLENLNVEALLEIDATTDIANCSVTQYRFARDRFTLEQFNDTSALDVLRAPVTRGNDASDLG